MLADMPRRRFTAAEVMRLVEVGVLAEDEPVELIDGALITVRPQGPRHSALATIVHERLRALFGAGYHVQDHSPIDGGAHSLPEPDVAVVRGAARDFLDHHPAAADLALVVELSVTSHALDVAKAAIYAAAGVAVYWQIEVPERRVVVRTDPVGSEYRSIRIHRDGDAVPVAGTTVQVAELLP